MTRRDWSALSAAIAKEREEWMLDAIPASIARLVDVSLRGVASRVADACAVAPGFSKPRFMADCGFADSTVQRAFPATDTPRAAPL